MDGGNESMGIHLGYRRIENVIFSYGFYILLILVCLFFSIMSSVFLSLENMVVILGSSCFIMLAAGGVTPVFVSGNMDMSIGSIALVSAGITALLARAGWDMPSSIGMALLAGAAIGLINGILVTFIKLNSMLTTLGLMIAYRGLGLVITDGRTIMLPNEYKAFAQIKILNMPIQIAVSLLVMVILYILLKKTRFGAYCYAMGCNGESVKKLGIPVKRVKVTVYIISGICAAMTGIIVATKLGLMRNTVGKGMEFRVVAAVVIGGTSLLGGKGNVLPGTLLGVLLLYVIDNGLAGLGASPYVYPFVQGLIIFLAMYMDSLSALRIKRS
ncbi:MAG: ABC transporter permease [Tannerellaceae bacterium]|jgi:ribose/xylose/arabinose/galactoside ABC-type transport system permease subunit|nr:ABC transporter permease [Tannerellaceae bacterium]